MQLEVWAGPEIVPVLSHTDYLHPNLSPSALWALESYVEQPAPLCTPNHAHLSWSGETLSHHKVWRHGTLVSILLCVVHCLWLLFLSTSTWNASSMWNYCHTLKRGMRPPWVTSHAHSGLISFFSDSSPLSFPLTPATLISWPFLDGLPQSMLLPQSLCTALLSELPLRSLWLQSSV